MTSSLRFWKADIPRYDGENNEEPTEIQEMYLITDALEKTRSMTPIYLLPWPHARSLTVCSSSLWLAWSCFLKVGRKFEHIRPREKSWMFQVSRPTHWIFGQLKSFLCHSWTEFEKKIKSDKNFIKMGQEITKLWKFKFHVNQIYYL